MSSNQICILIILILYFILNLGFGIFVSRRKSNKNLGLEKEFFIGGRNLSGLVLAMTTVATYTSVSSFISGPSAAATTYGYAQAWVAVVQVPVSFLVLGVLGNKLAEESRRTGEMTIVGYLNHRYNNKIFTIIISFLMLVFFLTQMIGQFKGGATLVSVVTNLDYKASLIIFGLVVIIYTAIGGFTAVAFTDLLQGFVMCIGTVLLLFYVLRYGGGLENIDASLQENLPGVYDNLTSVYTPGALLSFWILVGFGTIGLPQTAVRAMSFKDTRSLRRAMIIGTITCSLIMLGMHLAGVWAGAFSQEIGTTDSDYFIPSLITKIMPAPIAGIFLAAPMAAVMSTVDSLLLLSVASIVRDIFKIFFVSSKPSRNKIYNTNIRRISTIITVVLGLLVLILSINPPGIIFFINLFAMGGLECAFLWPLIGGLMFQEADYRSALISSVLGVATYIICYQYVDWLGINAVVYGLVIGGISYFVSAKVFLKKQ